MAKPKIGLTNPKTIEEIRNVFTSSHGAGRVWEIVLSEFKKSEHAQNIDSDREKTLKIFSDFECPNIVEFIRIIDKNVVLYNFSTININFDEVLESENPKIRKSKNPMGGLRNLIKLTIGDKSMGISPLKWFFYLSKGFGQLSEIQRFGFDLFCKDIVRLERAPVKPLPHK